MTTNVAINLEGSPRMVSCASCTTNCISQVVNGDLLKVMSWYDNEWGYACQMVRESVKTMH
jgi:glyceraldehyde 3-phosphate dehydrogenase